MYYIVMSTNIYSFPSAIFSQHQTPNIQTSKSKKMFFFSKIKQISERMAQGKQQPQFERNPCIRFTEIIATRTDGRQTMDKIRFHELC